MRNKIHKIMLLLLFFSAISCNKNNNESTNKNKGKTYDLTIGVTPTLDCLPLFIAYENNLFSKNNIKTQLKLFTAHMDCDTAIIGKSVDMCVSDLVRTEQIKKKGIALSYFTTTQLAWKMIVNKNARITTPKQLGDKTLAITRYSAINYLADMIIKNNKPKNNVFYIQVNDIYIRTQMLLNNEIDAALLPEPFATEVIAKQNKIIDNGLKYNNELGIICVRDEYKNEGNNIESLKKITNIYNQCCDSLNVNGMKKYTKVIKKYCNVDNNIIEKLPKMKFNHATLPNEKLINIAKNAF